MKLCKDMIFPVKRALRGTLFAIAFAASVSAPVFGAQELGGAGTAAEDGWEGQSQPGDAGAEEILGVPVTMEVVYGYQNTAKTGRYLPLEVTLQNHQLEPFSGTLCILTMEPQEASGQVDYSTYRYEYPVKIEAGGKPKLSFSVSMGSDVDQMYLILLDDQGNEVGRKRLKLNLNKDTAELFLGVLSDSPDRLLFLNNVGVSYSTLRTRNIELTAATLPTDEIGLDQLDVLLINDFDTGALSKEQVDAVWEWVGKGGVLLFGTGARGSDTLRAFRQELLEAPIPQPEVYEVNMGVEYAVDGPQGAVIPLTCTEVSLAGGNEVLSSDELSVLSSVTVGSGIVAVAVYDFKDIETFCQANQSYVDGLFTALLGEERIANLSSAMDVGAINRYWSVQSLINGGNVSKLPKVGLYVTLAAAYIILAGPGLYMFLKHRGIGRYYQSSVVVLSICCTGMVFLMGSATRFQGPFFTYAVIKDAEEGGVTETVFFNMRSPYNRPYSVELDPSYTLYPITGNPYYYTRQPRVRFTGQEKPSITLHYGEDSTRISVGNVGAFNSRFFQLERHGDNEEGKGFSGNIQSFDGNITGTLTNNYDQTVENVALLLYNQLLIIDSMEPGETVILDDLEVLYGVTNFSYAMAAQITGLSGFNQEVNVDSADYVEALERTNLLSFYIENYLSGYHTNAQVVAFSRDKEDKGFLKLDGYETYGTTLLTSTLDLNCEQDGMLYRSAMQKQPNVLSGDYYFSNNTIYGSSPVILEYFLGNDIEVEKLSFNRLSDEVVENLRFYYTVPFTGTMYFYNYNSGSYDAMDISVAEYRKEDLEPYLSPGNTLTVKYIYDTGGDYTRNIMLPIVTVTGRSK